MRAAETRKEAARALSSLDEEIAAINEKIDALDEKIDTATREGDVSAPIRKWNQAKRAAEKKLADLGADRGPLATRVKFFVDAHVGAQVEALGGYCADTHADIAKEAPKRVKEFERFRLFVERVAEIEAGVYSLGSDKAVGLARKIGANESHPPALYTAIGIRSAAQWKELSRAISTVNRLLEKE